MAWKMFSIMFTVTCVVLLSSCGAQQASPTPQADMPNPASVYCEDNGGKLELREDANGGQAGFCVFDDGSECDEWAYYRDTCQVGDSTQADPTATPELTEQASPPSDPVGVRDAFVAYLAETYGDEAPATGLAWEETHTKPAGMVGGESYEYTAGDWLITVAYPVVAPENVIYTVTVTNQATGFHREAEVAAQLAVTEIMAAEETPDESVSREIPTPLPIDPADYAGFWTYTHPDYNFSIMLPEDWAVVETTTGDPLMSGHALTLQPRLQAEGAEGLGIRMSFRRVGEETLLWPTGVGSGEFIEMGTLDVGGEPVRRIYFVCPNGQINSVWYHGGENEAKVQRGDLEFGFIFILTGSYCEGDGTLDLKTQRVGEMIIASLSVE